MAEKDIVRKLVPFKNVVKEPGFNYRKNLPPIPDDIKELLRENIKLAQVMARDKGEDAGRRVKVFEWPKLDAFIADNKTLNVAQRVKLRRVLGLAQNIYRRGLLEPIIVRESGADKDDNRTYFLVAGERRHLACDAIGLTQIEIKVKKGTAAELKIDRLSENLQREDPDPFEEADALYELLVERKELRKGDGEYTQATMAEELGVSEAYISQRLSMRKKATPAVREAVEVGQISTAHVREIATLSVKDQDRVLSEIKDKLEKGEKVTAADVKDKTDAVKVKQRAVKDAEKQTAKNGKAEGKTKPKAEGAEERHEQVNAMASYGYDPKAFNLCSKREVSSMLVVECQRLDRVKTDRARFEAKGRIAALEAVLGVRSLG